MIYSIAFIWLLMLAVAFQVYLHKGRNGLVIGAKDATAQGKNIIIRLPLALVAGAFLTEIVPDEVIASLIGNETGFVGVIFASVLGGFMPGGPMISFPIALFIWNSGAGLPQVVALLAGWSVLAFHRILAFETPLLGWRFSLLRVTSGLFIPPLAGGITMLILTTFPSLAIG